MFTNVYEIYIYVYTYTQVRTVPGALRFALAAIGLFAVGYIHVPACLLRRNARRR
jgi:hypothetical protein